jgi:hypothetical protein
MDRHEDTNAGSEVTIRRQIDLYTQAVNDADTALAGQVWATNAQVSFIHPRGHELGWDAVRHNFYEETMGAVFIDRSLEIRDVAVRIHGDSAWAEFYWNFRATVRADGSTLRTEGRETQIFWRGADGWRLVHVHYSGPARTGALEGF